MVMELGKGYIDLSLYTKKFNAQTSLVDIKLKALHAQMKKVSAKAKMMLMVGGAMAGGAIKLYADYEKSLANVSTMLDKLNMNLMPEYDRNIRMMAKSYGESTKTLTKGLYDILSASVAADKALDVLAVSVKAAKAGYTDTAVSADAITTILNSYALEAERAADVSDLLFAIVKRGKTTYGELASKIGQVAAVSAMADLSLEEMGAALATMTRAGLRTRIAVTALRALLTQFMTPSEEAAKLAREFGFELNTSTLKAIGLTGVLKKLRGATAEQLAVLMPNIRGLVGFAAALQNAETHVSDLDLMVNRFGMSQEAYDKMTRTLSHDLDTLWQSIKMAAVAIGESLRPEIVKLSDKMKEIANHIEEWVQKNGEWTAGMMKFTAEALLAVIALEKLLKAVIALKAVGGIVAAGGVGGAALTSIGLATAAVYLADKAGETWGDIISKMDEVVEKFERIKVGTSAFIEASEELNTLEKEFAKHEEIKFKLMNRDVAEMEKQNKALTAAIKMETKRIEARKKEVKAVALGDMSGERRQARYKKIQDDIRATEQSLEQHKAMLAYNVNAIKLLEMEKRGRAQLQKVEDETTRIELEGRDKIKDIEIEILKARKDGNAEAIAATREYEKALEDIKQREEAFEALPDAGKLPKAFHEERSKQHELLQAKLQAIEDEKRKAQLAKDKEAADKLAQHKKDLELEFTRLMKGETAAQLLELKREYEDMKKTFVGDTNALSMLDAVMKKKLENILKAIQDEIRMSIVDPSQMWRHLATSMNLKGGEDTQKRLLSEFISESRRKEQSDTNSLKTLDRIKEFLEIISRNSEMGVLRP